MIDIKILRSDPLYNIVKINVYNNLCCEGQRGLQEDAQGGCEFSFSGDIQDQPGCVTYCRQLSPAGALNYVIYRDRFQLL